MKIPQAQSRYTQALLCCQLEGGVTPPNQPTLREEGLRPRVSQRGVMWNSRVFGGLRVPGWREVDSVGAGARFLPSSHSASCPLPHCTLGETEAQEEEEPGPRLHRFFKAFKVSTPAPASVSPCGWVWHGVEAGSNLSSQWLGLRV